jgi:hypothetical protein
MLALIFVALAAAAAAQPAGSRQAPRAAEPCKYEENCGCAVPGITIRWRAAYCMSLNETDDFEQEGVQSCLARPEPERLSKLNPCDRNAYWKEEICRAMHPGDEDAVRACAKDPKVMPRIVERGVGG